MRAEGRRVRIGAAIAVLAVVVAGVAYWRRKMAVSSAPIEVARVGDVAQDKGTKSGGSVAIGERWARQLGVPGGSGGVQVDAKPCPKEPCVVSLSGPSRPMLEAAMARLTSEHGADSSWRVWQEASTWKGAFVHGVSLMGQLKWRRDEDLGKNPNKPPFETWNPVKPPARSEPPPRKHSVDYKNIMSLPPPPPPSMRDR